LKDRVDNRELFWKKRRRATEKPTKNRRSEYLTGGKKKERGHGKEEKGEGADR